MIAFIHILYASLKSNHQNLQEFHFKANHSKYVSKKKHINETRLEPRAQNIVPRYAQPVVRGD